MKHSDSLSIYHHSIGKVLSSKKKQETVQALKNDLTYNILCEITDSLSVYVKPLQFSIHGSALPFSLEDLGKSDALFKPLELDNEIKWQLLSVRKYSKEIGLFLLLKSDFEKYFLLGNYEKAQTVLQRVLKDTGYSLWYIEAKFLLLEYQNKSEEQKEFLSEIHEINKNGIVSTMAHFLSQRTERNLSAYKFDYDIDNIFRHNKNRLEDETRDRYKFRLNYFENYKLNDYSYVVLFENKNSIIDRYLVLSAIFKAQFVNEATRGYAYAKARYMFKKTQDKSLLPILYAFNPETVNEAYYDKSYIQILDLYYSGFYDDAIIEIRKHLAEDPKHFDLYIIYGKCFVNSKRDFESITEDSGVLINQLAIKIYNLISGKQNRTDLLYNLYQINKNLLTFEIAAGLDYFLKQEQSVSCSKYLKLLSLTAFDPYFAEIYSDENGKASAYLSNGESKFGKSLAVTRTKQLMVNDLSLLSSCSLETKAIDEAKILYKLERFEDSLSKWTQIIQFYCDNIPIVQIALKYWFNCLLKLEKYNEAISLFVENYIMDPNSICKINSDELLQILRRIKYKGVKRSIDLPVFVALTSFDDLEKSFILEQYCKIFQKEKPSELFSESLDVSNEKRELFYYRVCATETLKHSIWINTTIERLTERQSILNHLIEISPDNKKIFEEELNLVSNELIIYEGTQKLEESKIYANDQAIINYELGGIDGLFKRYKTIYNLSLKDKKILVIADGAFALLKLDDQAKYKETEVKYSDSALLEVFIELFDLILDKYLFSKFGIVAYLSTRIRHGVLLGEIRPELDKKNLILSRIGESDRYEESKFWKNFPLALPLKLKLHDILTKFSLRIDTAIEGIINHKIQIKKDGKNALGLFNYEFDRSELNTYANDLALESDVKVFSQKIIDLIWKRTDANLEVIRSYIDNEIKNKFSEELNKLNYELSLAIPNAQLPLIYTNVTECSTIIENKLKKISSWFRRSGSAINDFEISKMFNIVWANTERCYPKVPAECQLKITFDPIIRASYYIHFTDLFRIFIDNMFKYGGFKDKKKRFQFLCRYDNGYLVCSFSNLKSLEYTKPPYIVQNGELVVDDNKLLSEGNSGISKAIKTVKFDLGNESNSVKSEMDDPEMFTIEVAIKINNLIKNEEDPDSGGQ